MRLKLSPRARQDVTEIGRYIRARNPVAALAVRDAINRTLKVLSAYPYAGRVIGDGDLRRFVVPRLPYLVFYVADAAANELQIVTIRHTAREEFEPTSTP